MADETSARNSNADNQTRFGAFVQKGLCFETARQIKRDTFAGTFNCWSPPKYFLRLGNMLARKA
jgi:hypothetical protein